MKVTDHRDQDVIFFFSVTIEIDSARFWRMDKVFASAVVIGRR